MNEAMNEAGHAESVLAPVDVSNADQSAERMLRMCWINFLLFRSVYMIAKLGIPDLLKQRPRKADEIADLTGMKPRPVYRLLRAVSSVGILHESSDHTFSLTPLGETLRKDAPGSLWGLAVYSGEPFYLKVFEEFAYSIRTGKPAFDKVHGVSEFEYYEQNSEVGEIFYQCMIDWSYEDAVAVANAYDFSGGHAVMDVGGGHGYLLAEILKANPHLRGLLFEQQHVLEGARSFFEQSGVLPRCQLVAGDFFVSIPSGADVYIMKSVLHDWEDPECMAILNNCRNAMGKAGRLLLVETVVPPPNEYHYANFMDLEMLVLSGGQERTIEEFEALFAQSDLRLSQVVPTEGNHSIIEVVPA